MAKVLTSIVAENLSRIVEEHHILPKTHFGGRPGRSTADAVHLLVDKVCTAWRSNKVASVLFLDVEGAFPNAVTSRLIHNLRRRRIPTVIVNFVKQLLTGRKTRLKFDDFISGIINITNGIGQGDPLSMLLYILYNADMLDIPDNPLVEDAIGYVDDIALIATGTDFEETTQRLTDMMTREGGGLQWSTDHNSRFEVSKSAVLHLSRKTIPDPNSDHGRVPLPKPALTLGGQVVQEVQSYKYLGIQVDAHLRWREQAQRAIANSTKWILQFRRLTKPSTGVKPRLMRQLYLSVALPKITYGIDIWYTPPTKPAGSTRNTGSAGVLRQLQKSQRLATLAITGTLRTSPNDYVDIHANVYPIELALLKACHSALVRTLTLPNTNPIYQIARRAKRRPPSKFPGPIDILLKLFALRNTIIETIYPAITLQRAPNRITTVIDKSREDSIKSEANDPAEFKIFSDSSGHDNGIGSAAILYEKGRRRHIKSLQVYLGTPDKRNTYEAEIIGAILALWVLQNTPETLGKTVTLYIDNQSLIKAIETPSSTSGQHLLNSLRLSLNGTACRLTIRWISSHSKVKGNEDVDKAAKNAAAGHSSPMAILPHLLRNPLPVSASALKQEYNSKLRQKWKEIWEASPRRPRIAQLGEEFPFSAFLLRLSLLTRKQSSLILQIRCGHFPLNAYLHKINKSDTNTCPACLNEQEGRSSVETISHFIFDCEAHVEAREELIDKIGMIHLNLLDIMADTERMKALTTFINRSGRFRE